MFDRTINVGSKSVCKRKQYEKHCWLPTVVTTKYNWWDLKPRNTNLYDLLCFGITNCKKILEQLCQYGIHTHEFWC